MTDHLKEAYEHERSERTGCRATARRCRGASKDRAIKPSGHASETEWSDRVVIQSLVVGPGSAGRAISGARGDTHKNSSPSGQCFSLFCQYAGTTSYADSSRWPMGHGFLLFGSTQNSPRRRLLDWFGFAGPGFSLGTSAYCGRARELRLATLSTPSRWRHTLAFLKVPGDPRVPRPGLTVESGRDGVVWRVPREEART